MNLDSKYVFSFITLSHTVIVLYLIPPYYYFAYSYKSLNWILNLGNTFQNLQPLSLPCNWIALPQFFTFTDFECFVTIYSANLSDTFFLVLHKRTEKRRRISWELRSHIGVHCSWRSTKYMNAHHVKTISFIKWSVRYQIITIENTITK